MQPDPTISRGWVSIFAGWRYPNPNNTTWRGERLASISGQHYHYCRISRNKFPFCIDRSPRGWKFRAEVARTPLGNRKPPRITHVAGKIYFRITRHFQDSRTREREVVSVRVSVARGTRIGRIPLRNLSRLSFETENLFAMVNTFRFHKYLNSSVPLSCHTVKRSNCV